MNHEQLLYETQICANSDCNGDFPYVDVSGDAPETPGSGSNSTTYNKFINVRDLDLTNTQLVVLTEDVLSEAIKIYRKDSLL